MVFKYKQWSVGEIVAAYAIMFCTLGLVWVVFDLSPFPEWLRSVAGFTPGAPANSPLFDPMHYQQYVTALAVIKAYGSMALMLMLFPIDLWIYYKIVTPRLSRRASRSADLSA